MAAPSETKLSSHRKKKGESDFDYSIRIQRELRAKREKAAKKKEAARIKRNVTRTVRRELKAERERHSKYDREHKRKPKTVAVDVSFSRGFQRVRA